MRADARALAALVAVQTLFGLHYLAAKVVVQTIPPRPWSLIRAGTAGLLMLAFVALRGTPLPRDRGLLLRLAGLALLGVALNQWLFVEGLHRTTPGHSALINTSMPVTVALFAVLTGRERPTWGRYAGIGITMIGILVLIGPAQADWSGEGFSGDLLTLLNALSYSWFLVLGKPVFERMRTIPASALLLVFGGIWLLPVGLPGLAALRPAGIDLRIAGLAAFIVLGPTIAAYGLNTYALRRVDSSLVAFFIYLQPVLGVGLSLVLGFERPSLRLAVAAAIVFAGVYVALRPALRRRPRSPADPLAGAQGFGRTSPHTRKGAP